MKPILGNLFILVISAQFLSIAATNSSSASDDAVSEKACDPARRPAVIYDAETIIKPLLTENGTYELDMECRWLVQAPRDSIVALDFSYIDLDHVHPCLDANLSVYDFNSTSDSHKIDMFCGSTTTPTLHSSYIDMLVVFKSGKNGEGAGFEGNISFIYIQGGCNSDYHFTASDWVNGGFYTPGWYHQYPPNENCEWRISSQVQIRLEFLWFNVNPCPAHVVTVVDGSSNSSTEIGRYCGYKNQYTVDTRAGEVINPPFLPIGSTGGLLQVKFSSNYESGGNGFRARFTNQNVTAIGCSSSKPVLMDWSPGVIVNPQSKTSQCSWRLGTIETRLIKLTSVYFDLPNCSSCECARLELYDGETHNDALIGEFCGSGWGNYDEIVFTGEFGFIQYYSTELIYPHQGFRLEYKFYDTAKHACGSDKPVVFTHAHGLITSPNYGIGEYPENSNCQWLVRTKFGSVLSLDFNDFELEDCSGCQCDYLHVYNGEDPTDERTEMDKLCGTSRPPSLLSTQPAIYLTFVSDRADNKDGFKIHFSSIYVPDNACNVGRPAPMSHQPGIIISQGYESGEDYKPNSFCTWLITAPLHNIVRLKVEDFSVEYDDHCTRDYLEVYDGMDVQHELIARMCGEVGSSQVLESSRSEMYLLFYSDNQIQSRGFHLEFTYTDTSSRSVGIGFLPGLLIAMVIIGIFIIIGAYCHASKRFKKFRSWVGSLIGRQNNQSHDHPDRVVSQSEGRDDSSRDSHHQSNPVPLGRVTSPPSDVDNMTYYAIADYAPPTYEEATSHRRRDSTQQSSQSNPDLEQSPSAGDNNASNSSNQNQPNNIFPSRQNSNMSSRLSDIQSNSSSVLGNPDMGMGILMQTGIYTAPSRPPSNSRTSASRIPPESTPCPSTHSEALGSIQVGASAGSVINTSIISRDPSTSFTDITQDSAIYNPVYAALHRTSLDRSLSNDQHQSSENDDEDIYAVPKDMRSFNNSSENGARFYDDSESISASNNKRDRNIQIQGDHGYNNNAFIKDSNRSNVNMNPLGRAVSKTSINSNNMGQTVSNNPRFEGSVNIPNQDGNKSSDRVSFQRLNSASFNTEI